MSDMKKIFCMSFLILFVLTVACASREKQEMCNLSDVVTCALYYTTQEEIQACALELSGVACELSTENLDQIDASLSHDTFFTCNSSADTIQAVEEKGFAVTHVPDSSKRTIYVDPLHNPLVDHDSFSVTYTIQGAIDLVDTTSQATQIVICPGQYYENLSISNSDKDGLEITNLADGDGSLAELTVIRPLTPSTVLEINGAVSIKLSGLTLKDGNATYGGGIYVSVFRDDVTAFSRIEIRNSIIEDNTSILSGGGLFVEGYADIYMVNVSFLRNDSSIGGAIAIQSNDSVKKLVYCRDCQISQNSALVSGSAVNVGDGDRLILINSDLQLNYPFYSSVPVAAIRLEGLSYLFAREIDWGSDSSENIGADVNNLSDAEETLFEILSDLEESQSEYSFDINEILGMDLAEVADWLKGIIDSMDSDSQNFNLALEKIQSLSTETPWLYDYSGVETVQCNLSGSQNSCNN